MTVATYTVSDMKTFVARARARQIQYDQSSASDHGQLAVAGRSDMRTRNDCSGLICALAHLSYGVYCASTAELVSDFLSDPIDWSQVVPYKTVSIVRAMDDGGAFGHVAQVIGFRPEIKQVQIFEHGGGIGPITRWLPPGQIYDSEARYGHSRPFKFRNLLNVTADAVTPSNPDSSTDKDDYVATLDPKDKQDIIDGVVKQLLGAQVTYAYNGSDNNGGWVDEHQVTVSLEDALTNTASNAGRVARYTVPTPPKKA